MSSDFTIVTLKDRGASLKCGGYLELFSPRDS